MICTIKLLIRIHNRIYKYNIKTMSADLKIIKGAIKREKLQATNYTCRIGGK